MLTIGDNELGPVLGADVECPHCGERHPVRDSGPSERYNHDGTREVGPAGLLQFYSCPRAGKSYLCGIKHRSIPA